MKKRETSLWYGFLDAGKCSSPVVRDSNLDTGKPSTIYLFNLERGRILEYRRDIVERKLRELSADERSTIKTLQEAFHLARAGFTPRGKRRTVPPTRHRKKREEPELPDFDCDEILPSSADGEQYPYLADYFD